MFIFEHDNGKRGQNGYAESLEKEGIIVYSIYKAD